MSEILKKVFPNVMLANVVARETLKFEFS